MRNLASGEAYYVSGHWVLPHLFISQELFLKCCYFVLLPCTLGSFSCWWRCWTGACLFLTLHGVLQMGEVWHSGSLPVHRYLQQHHCHQSTRAWRRAQVRTQPTFRILLCLLLTFLLLLLLFCLYCLRKKDLCSSGLCFQGRWTLGKLFTPPVTLLNSKVTGGYSGIPCPPGKIDLGAALYTSHNFVK